jgi:hypothetical protein
MPAVQTETLRDYCAQREGGLLAERFDLGVPYVLVAKDDLDKLTGPNEVLDFWERFYRRYPHAPGLIGFSNVGFNQAHTQAFVYISHGCGGLCGEGEYVLLEKRGGAWHIIDQMGLWVS